MWLIDGLKKLLGGPRAVVDIWPLIDSGVGSKSGVTVTRQTALDCIPVAAAARVISEGVAQFPLKLMRDTEDGRGSEPARDHPLFEILHERPNERVHHPILPLALDGDNYDAPSWPE